MQANRRVLKRCRDFFELGDGEFGPNVEELCQSLLTRLEALKTAAASKQ